jgi:multiple sugar transport system permease protein
MTAKSRAGLLVLPTVLVLALIVIFPMIFSITVSLRDYDIRRPEHPFYGLKNYGDVLTDGEFYNAAAITGTMVAAELILEFGIGLALALALVNLPNARKIFQPILLVPMMVMPVVIGYMGMLVFEVRSGPINYFLNLLGLESLSWHASPQLALITILILRVWQWTPFVMAVMLAGLLSLPIEPFDSAQVDGANTWQIFTRITMPMLRQVTMLVVVMRALEVLQALALIYIVTLGGPGSRTTTLSLFTYLVGFRYWNVGKASAVAWLLMIPLSILITIFVRVMERGERVETTK